MMEHSEELRTYRDPITALLVDLITFLEQPEHEIVRTYSDDHQREPIYCGLALSWEEEHNALLARLKRQLPEPNQFLALITDMGMGSPNIFLDDAEDRDVS